MVAYEIQISNVNGGVGEPTLLIGNNVAEIMEEFGAKSGQLAKERLTPDKVVFRRVPLLESDKAFLATGVCDE